MVRRNFQDLPVLRCRSLSPSVPYLYPDKANEDIENKYRKGWYRVDYGGSEDQKLWYLPKFSDRLKFLEYHVDKKKGYPRAVSVPPVPTIAKSISRPRPTTPTHYYTQPATKTTYTFRSPYSPYLSTLGPYSGRSWSLDYYRYPYYSTYSWRYPYSYYSYPSYSTYSSSLETQLALARADRALSRSTYYPSYYPSSYYRDYANQPYYY